MRWIWLALLLLCNPAVAQPLAGSPMGPTQQTLPINVGIGTTQIIPLLASARIYVTGALLAATAADTVQFVYGTGANCVTGQTALTGVIPLQANVPLSWGSGSGLVLIVPVVGNALCIVTTAATVGVIGYTQF